MCMPGMRRGRYGGGFLQRPKGPELGSKKNPYSYHIYKKRMGGDRLSGIDGLFRGGGGRWTTMDDNN